MLELHSWSCPLEVEVLQSLTAKLLSFHSAFWWVHLSLQFLDAVQHSPEENNFGLNFGLHFELKKRFWLPDYLKNCTSLIICSGFNIDSCMRFWRKNISNCLATSMNLATFCSASVLNSSLLSCVRGNPSSLIKLLTIPYFAVGKWNLVRPSYCFVNKYHTWNASSNSSTKLGLFAVECEFDSDAMFIYTGCENAVLPKLQFFSHVLLWRKQRPIKQSKEVVRHKETTYIGSFIVIK